jgi:2-aminoadipate transaminase
LSLEVDDHGLDTCDLDRALRSGPKFIYLLPNFQNPTGVSLSLERTKLLVQRADHYGIPIIEDHPYGQLRYEGNHLPTLVILDALAR